MDIGERIRELRKNSKVSQAELAKKIGVSSGNVGDWERGRVKPGAEALIALMNYFKVSADYLLTGKEQQILTEKTEKVKESNSQMNFTEEEIDMIMKFRKLNYEDQQDTIDIIDMKYNRKVKRGMSSNSSNGGTGEEAATSEAV